MVSCQLYSRIILLKIILFHSYNTRIKDCLHVDLFASSLGQRSIKYKDSILWNTLPEEIKAITSTVLSVNKLHKILLQLYTACMIVCSY